MEKVLQKQTKNIVSNQAHVQMTKRIIPWAHNSKSIQVLSH